MIYALIVMTVVVPAAVGYGQLLRHLLGIENPPTFLRAIAIDGLLGLLVMGTIAMALNFVMALSGGVAVTVNAVGWVMLGWRIRHQGVRPTWGQFILVCVLFLFFAVESIREITYYDTALYHIQCVLWAKAQAVPLGLGNLHNRLAMTTMWFPLATLLWLPGMTVVATFTISALTAFLFSCLVADCARNLIFSPTGYRSISDWFAVLCVYGLVYNTFLTRMAEMVSLSNDLPPVAATFAVMILLLPRDTDEPLTHRLPLATLMATLSFTAKLSSAPLLAVIGLTLAWRWWRDGYPRVMGKTILASGVMVAVWITRSIWTSGMPLFPASVLQLDDARWTVRSPHVLVAWIKSWARVPKPGSDPAKVLANWDWLTPWWQRMLELEALWVMAFGLGAAIVLAPFVVRRFSRAAIALWLVAAGGVAFWFLMAPDPRFGWGSIYSAAAIPVAGVLSQVKWLRFRWLAIPLATALCIVPLCRERFVPETHLQGAMIKPQIPPFTWITKYTDQGEPINIPGDRNTAWDTPIPGTPYFATHLKIERNAAGKITEIWFPRTIAPATRPVTRPK